MSRLGSFGSGLAAVLVLWPGAASPAELGSPSALASVQQSARGDWLFRQARFAEAENSYVLALELDTNNVRGHLGIGKISELQSQPDRAIAHYLAAYQIAPLDPNVILAYASVVEDRPARQVLLRNFLARSREASRKDATVGEALAKLQLDQQLGGRKVFVRSGSDRPYRFRISEVRQPGLVLHARLNDRKDLKLIVDTGASGIVLNASASCDEQLELLAPATLWGFGSDAPRAAQVALASSIQVGDLLILNPLLQISATDLTPDADGVIGLDIFRNFLVRVSPRERTLDLTPLPGPTTRLACSDCTPVYRLGHLLLLHGIVNGKADGYFILDSGSPRTIVSSRLVPSSERVATVIGVQGRQSVSTPSSPVSLQIDSRDFLDFDYATLDTGTISSRNGVEIAGVIGYSLLRHLEFTVNYRDGWVRIGKPLRH